MLCASRSWATNPARRSSACTVAPDFVHDVNEEEAPGSTSFGGGHGAGGDPASVARHVSPRTAEGRRRRRSGRGGGDGGNGPARELREGGLRTGIARRLRRVGLGALPRRAPDDGLHARRVPPREDGRL